MLKTSKLILSIFVFYFALQSFAVATETDLTLEDAINLALEKNPEILASKAGVNSADASRKQARGNYGPKLMVSSNVMFWDEESTLALSDGSSGAVQLPAPNTPYETAFAGTMQQLSQPMTIQEQITSETQVQVAMPLNPLYQIHQGYKIASLGHEASKSESVNTNQNVVLNVVTAYFNVLQAKAQLDTAKESVEHLEEQTRVVETFVEQGLLAKNDLLKIMVARADSEKRLIEAKSMVDLTRTNLAAITGSNMDVVFNPYYPKNHVPKPIKRSLGSSINSAMSNRPEIAILKIKNEQADRGRKIAIANMFPNLALVGIYKHSEGIKMGKEDSFFGGLTLEWTAWEWGATYYGIEKAKQANRQVELLRKNTERMIALQVRRSKIDMQTAFKSLDVVEAALDQAKESFEIEKSNFANGMGTTADMLDAEAALAKANNNYISIAYQCFISKAAYLKAIGEPIESSKLF